MTCDAASAMRSRLFQRAGLQLLEQRLCEAIGGDVIKRLAQLHGFLGTKRLVENLADALRYFARFTVFFLADVGQRHPPTAAIAFINL